MKITLLIRKIALVWLLLLTSAGYAQATSEGTVRDRVVDFCTKFEKEKGVDYLHCDKGGGLGMLKLLLRKEFGRDLLKGTDLIVIFDYSEASESLAASIRAEFERFSDLMKQAPLEEQSEGGEWVRNYYKETDDRKALSDMLILFEDHESRSMIYFGGVLKMEDFDTE